MAVRNQTRIALDTECTGLLHDRDAAPFMLCMYSGRHYTVYEWPVSPAGIVDFSRGSKRAGLKEILSKLYDCSEWILHNSRFDLRMLDRAFRAADLISPSEHNGNWIDWSRVQDTHVASHTMDNLGVHGLKDLSEHYQILPADDERLLLDTCKALKGQLVRLAKNQPAWAAYAPILKWSHKRMYWLPKHLKPGTLDADLCETYCKNDVYRTYTLWTGYEELLSHATHSNGTTFRESYERSRLLLRAAYRLESEGLPLLPQDARDKALNTCDQRIIEIQTSMHETLVMHAGIRDLPNFSPASPIQLERVLEAFDINPTRTSSGLAGKSDEAYASYADASASRPPVSAFFNNCRELQRIGKTKSTIVSYAESEHLGRLWPSYNPWGTSTTRWSSANPNAQNVGHGKDEDDQDSIHRLRHLFGPPPGYAWFAQDYSQLEYRIFAVATGSQRIQEALASGVSVHELTAWSILGLPYGTKITKEQKKVGKTVNFGIMYGMGEKATDAKTAPGTYRKYLENAPEVAAFLAKSSAHARKHGFVETLGPCPVRLNVDPDRPYIAANYIVQGTAGIILNEALLRINHDDFYWPLTRRGVSVIGVIHDEINFLVKLTSNEQLIHDNYGGFVEGVPDRIMQILRLIEKCMIDGGRSCGVHTPTSCEHFPVQWGDGVSIWTN